jgi:predicted dehydrogenase
MPTQVLGSGQQSLTRVAGGSRQINLAQLGAGHWGINLIRNFSQLDGVGRFVVCDQDAERRNFVGERYPTVELTGSISDLLDDPSLDAVIIALPASLHWQYAKLCLEAGKHVFVEKPLTTRASEARELVELGRAADRVVMVGHTFLYNSAVRRVKEYIDSGELGEIYYIMAQRLNLGRVRQDVNAWWNLAPHDISILLYWLGEEPEEIQATGLTFLQEGVEDVVFANLRFPSGKAAHIHVSWLDPKKTRKMVVVGSKKMLVYDDVSTEAKIVLYDKGVDRTDAGNRLPDIESFSQFQLRQRSGDILIPKINFTEPLRKECQHFLDCVRDQTKPLSDAENGYQVVDILERGQKCLDASKPQSHSKSQSQSQSNRQIA